MKLATLRNGTRDGRLVVVARDLGTALDASPVAATLIAALETWTESAPRLVDLYAVLNAGGAAGAFPFDPAQAAAPLPRAPQWCDGSAFLNHSRLMQRAFNLPPIPDLDRIPLMYQGATDDLLGPYDDIEVFDESYGIDFEGEFGVIVDDVPMGCPVALAPSRIRLLVQINDISLRSFASREMRTGFGFFHAKPSSSFAPVAVTVDEIGDAWRDARIHLNLDIGHNGSWFGSPGGGEMHYGFDELMVHAAATRRLSAGTIIGSGTVSNANEASGSACIAERRALEMIASGAAKTPFMKFGDRVRMEARWRGRPVFGAIDQKVVRVDRPAAPGS